MTLSDAEPRREVDVPVCRKSEEPTALTQATVTLNEEVASETFRLLLAVPQWQCEDPDPGQFLMLRVTDDIQPLLARPFGISGFEREGHGARIEILYRVVGRGTRIMQHWEPGRKAAFLGPLGKGFDLPPAGSSSFLIAGGVGLPPLLAVARRMETLGRAGEARLLYGETRSDRLLPTDLEFFPGVKTETCTDDGSAGRRGMVTGLLEDRNRGKGSHIFVCGPNAMMRAVMDQTAGLCLSAQYSLEAHMACGFGVCTGCAVKVASGDYVRVCREGPVFDGADLSLGSFEEV